MTTGFEDDYPARPPPTTETRGYEDGYTEGFRHRMNGGRDIPPAALDYLTESNERNPAATEGSKSSWAAWRNYGWAEGYRNASEALREDRENLRAAEQAELARYEAAGETLQTEVVRYLAATGNDPDDEAAAIEWLHSSSEPFKAIAADTPPGQLQGRVYSILLAVKHKDIPLFGDENR